MEDLINNELENNTPEDIFIPMYTKMQVLDIVTKMCERHDNCRKYGQIWDLGSELKNILK